MRHSAVKGAAEADLRAYNGGTRMERVVVIGANEFQLPLIQKVREMGFEAHVFAWRDGSVGAEYATKCYPISIVEKDEILRVCREEIHPAAVTSIGSDLAGAVVQYLAERLNLNCNSADCQRKATNKYAMRRAFADAGVPVPGFAPTDGSDAVEAVRAAGLQYPLIVKPTDRSGSRAVTLVHDDAQLEKAARDAVRSAFEHRAIIEEYIAGDEYSCETISENGTHHILAVTKKFTTEAPHYIETAHLEPSRLSDADERRARDMVLRALDALGVTQGASHSEFRMDPQRGPRIIEVGARMGGDCIGSHLVHLSTGCDFVRMVVENALGRPVTLTPDQKPLVAYIRFIHTQEDYHRYLRVRAARPEAIRFTFGMEALTDAPLPEVVVSGSRHGHYILACDTMAEMDALLAL